MRPRGRREPRFASAPPFGAVCPARDAGVALVLPEVSTVARHSFLVEMARAAPTGTHAVPPNLTLVHLPSHSPELNPVERVWRYRRERWLSHRGLAGGHAAGLDAACAAWNARRAEPDRLRALTSFPWLPSAVSNS